MKKRIIALLCVLAILAPTIPVFASDTLYNEFKNAASLNAIRTAFINNTKFSQFSISADSPAYTTAEKSMIILEAARDKSFTSFSDLDARVTAAAEKLRSKQADTTFSNDLLGHTDGFSAAETISAPATTSADDIFKIGDQEFIALDSVTVGGEQMLYVMVKTHDTFGINNVVIDGVAQSGGTYLGRWDDMLLNSLPYRLTNELAFGALPGTGTINLPISVLEHIDVMHEWPVEPGSRSGYTSRHKYIAPISAISVTEYKAYASKIGLDGADNMYWTRTPVKGNSAQYYSITKGGNTFVTNAKGGYKMRPVFYLKSSFFKEEKMQACGKNVTAYIDEMLTRSEVENLYTAAEQQTVFGSLSITPTEITGDAVVGATLTADYTNPNSINLLDVEIVWEKSLDNATWISANGTNSKTYLIKPEDAGYYIRAVFKPTFDSVILANGAYAYAVKADAVYTEANVAQAVRDVDTSATNDELRSHLQTHQPLFHLDYSVGAFPENAATIFRNDRVNSVEDVILLYNQAIALNEFANATDADAKEKAESEYLLGSIADYDKITVSAQQNNIILNLFKLTEEKEQVSKFIARAKEIIILERFNNAERSNIISLIQEYASEFGINISGLSTYQLQIAGAYVAGKNYGTDYEKLKEAIDEGVEKARATVVPDNPVEDDTEDRPSSGYIPSVTEKPDPLETVPQSLFSDLNNVPWGVAAINYLAEKGILSGTGDGTFSPDRLVTRNEFVKMIVMAFGVELTGNDLSYEDIDNNSWSAQYIKAAVDAGIITGITDTRFGNDMNIQRQDAAVIAERLMKYKGLEMKSSSLKFKDGKDIADYAVMAVAKMKYNGIMNGKDGDIFAPEDGTTRAEAAVIIYNLVKYYESQTAEDDVAEDEVVIRNSTDKYDMLFSLGILKDEFVADSKITRGELAAALSVLGNYLYSAYEGTFKDVKESHKYAKEIEAIYRNNIMAAKTEGSFAPDETATYGQAYDAIIAASGYKNFAGGSQAAENALRQETVFANQDDELTADMLKKMLFAALDIPVLHLINTDTVAISESTILNTNFEAYKARGIVNAVAGVAIGGREEVDDDQLIITVGGKDYLYIASDNYYGDFLGCEVVYYYQEIDGRYYILFMMLADNAEKSVLQLNYEQVIDAERDLSAISYDKNNKIKHAKIAKNADFIYNGRRSYSITKADLIPNNGYITLIDTNRNGEYDVVKIEDYEYIMVAQIDASAKTILDKFTWQTYGFDEGVDADKVNITKNGRYLKMEYLSQGDILAVAKSRDGELINVYVSDKKVTGTIKKLSPNDYEIQIDNNKLKTVRNFPFDELSIGTSITAGLDWNNCVVGYYVELSNQSMLMGYFYRAAEDENVLSNAKKLCILASTNEIVALTTNSKVNLNGNPVADQSIFDSMEPQLIAYKLDSDGKIKHIYTALSPDEAQADTPLVLDWLYTSSTSNPVMAIYNGFGMTLSYHYNFPSSAVMYDIVYDTVTVEGQPDRKVFNHEKSRVTNVGAKAIPASTIPSKVTVYNADVSNVSMLCVYEHAPKVDNDSYDENFNVQAFVISDVIEKFDIDEGETSIAYKGYHEGDEVEYTFSKNLTETFETENIKAGDVLLIWRSGKEITKFRRLFALNETYKIPGVIDGLCNYGDHVYDGTAEPRPSGNRDNPYNWAQHIMDRVENNRYTTTVAGSVWASLYGDIELVYKSESYPYSVMKFKVAGESPDVDYSISSNKKSDTLALTMDGSTRVYVYRTKTGKVEVLDSHNMNFAGKKAVVTSKYGNVRDVVVYD